MRKSIKYLSIAVIVPAFAFGVYMLNRAVAEALHKKRVADHVEMSFVEPALEIPPAPVLKTPQAPVQKSTRIVQSSVPLCLVYPSGPTCHSL